MTDHDADLPPGLAAALARWAAATDPATDLVGGPALRARHRGRARAGRWALAAAVVLAVLAAATVWAGRDGNHDAVMTNPTPSTDVAGPTEDVELDVVVDTAGLSAVRAATVHSVALTPVCEDSQPCPTPRWPGPRPVEPGTSLAFIQGAPVGSTWEVEVRSWVCGRFSCTTDADGSPAGDDEAAPARCSGRVTVGGPTLAVLALSGPADQPTCDLTTDGPTPALTVPSVFTLREPLPWSCGTGAWDAQGEPSDPSAVREAWECLAEAATTDRGAELPVSQVGPDGEVLRSWWRAHQRDETGMVFVEVIRGPAAATDGRWTTQGCSRLVPDPDRTDGALTGDGCDPVRREAVLSYERPVAEPALVEPPSDEEPDDHWPVPSRDVVVAQADVAGPGPATADRWVITHQGEPVASGPLVAGTTVLGADDLALDGDTTIRWDRYDCTGTCPPVAADGRPAGAGTVAGPTASTLCEVYLPLDAPRLVARFQTVDGAPSGVDCEAVPVDALPPLDPPG